MPMQPTRYCSCSPCCPNRIAKGQRFCAQGQKLKDAQRFNALFRQLYHSERWRRRRREQLRAFPACEDCEAKGQLREATDAHHRQKPRSELEFWTNALASLCHACHSVRTQRGE